jgi:hypothetical protein
MQTITKEKSAQPAIIKKEKNTPTAFFDIGIGAKVPLIYENCLLKCLKPNNHLSTT